MSDNKKWWKTWSCIIHDAKFQNIKLEDIGFWTLLMSLICEQGERGKLTIIPPALVTLALLRCPTLESLKKDLKKLPNVLISPPLNDNGDFIVTIRKWYTYQVDSTARERVKTLRAKRRGEEKLTSKSTSTSPPLRGAAAPKAAPLPLAENTQKRLQEVEMTTQEMEQAESRERNYEWQKKLPEIPKAERMTPEEMKAIRVKNFGLFKSERTDIPRGGKT